MNTDDADRRDTHNISVDSLVATPWRRDLLPPTNIRQRRRRRYSVPILSPSLLVRYWMFLLFTCFWFILVWNWFRNMYLIPHSLKWIEFVLTVIPAVVIVMRCLFRYACSCLFWLKNGELSFLNHATVLNLVIWGLWSFWLNWVFWCLHRWGLFRLKLW